MDLSKKNLASKIYKFYSECFYFPDEEQLSLLISLKEGLPDTFQKLFDHINNLEELQVDFARLFVGPFEVLSPPYGSIYLEEGQKTFGDSTMEVVQLYQEEKLDIELNEPADHISIELEFMYFLITKEIEAIKRKEIRQSKLYFQKQKLFLERHLSKWVEEFTSSVLKNAKSDFYKELTKSLNICVLNNLNDYNFD